MLIKEKMLSVIMNQHNNLFSTVIVSIYALKNYTQIVKKKVKGYHESTCLDSLRANGMKRKKKKVNDGVLDIKESKWNFLKWICGSRFEKCLKGCLYEISVLKTEKKI